MDLRILCQERADLPGLVRREVVGDDVDLLAARRRERLHAITRFEITVANSALVGTDATRIELDGSQRSASEDVALADEARVHTLHITVGQTKVPR